MQKRTIIHKYSVVPLLAIAAMHAAVWLGTKSLADFSRAFDVTLGLDALIPLRPEWVVVYVGTFVFWGMGLLLIARQPDLTISELLKILAITKQLFLRRKVIIIHLQ